MTATVLTPLPDVAELNPRRFTEQPSDSDLVSFVPMKSVEEESGRLNATEHRLWGEVKKGYTAFQNGDVIFAKITPCMENGKFAFASGLHAGRAAGSTEFHVLRAKPGLDARYLMHFLFTPEVRRAAKMNMKGAAGQLRVPTQFLEGLRIPVPSIEQQREAVAYLDEQLSRLDASVTALLRAKANLKRYRASVLKAACGGRLVPTEAELARAEGRTFETGAELLQRILAERREGNGMRKEPTEPEVNNLPTLPDGWAWANLQQLALVSGGLTKNPKRETLPTKLPYLRVANVYANELRLDQIEHIGVAPAELNKLLLVKDDLLVVEGNGSPDQIGRVALWNGSIAPCVHQNHLIKVRLRGAEPRWVLNWLLSPQGRNQIERVTSSTSGLHTLSTGKVSALRVPLPPLPEQHRIVAEADRRLSLIRGAEAQVSANLARAKRLRQSILQAAFAQPGSAGQ